MPVVGIPTAMLEDRLGFFMDRQELVQHLMHLGCEVEGFAELNRFKCRRCDQVTDVTQTQDAPVEDQPEQFFIEISRPSRLASFIMWPRAE